MEKMKSKLEAQTIRVIERSIDLWLVIYAFVSSLGLLLIDSNDKLIQGVIIAASLLFGILGVYFGKEYFIHLTMKFLKIFNDAENNLCGLWEIRIDYTEGGKSIGRRGTVRIEKTPIGLTLKGGKIYDSNKHEEVVESWVSDYVELSVFNKQRILQYAFRIKREDDKVMEFSKIGHVVLKSTDPNYSIFKGTYVDLFIPVEDSNDTEKLRNGNVLLRRAES